jgi:signal transduction histidine kinase/GAF domain-containing protein
MDSQDGKLQVPIGEESNILERVARIISSVRGAKPDYAHLAAELEPALPFDIFGIVLLRHDHLAVRVTVCQREGADWIAHYHQHPLTGSMVERVVHVLTPGGAAEREGKAQTDPAGTTQEPTSDDLLAQKFPEGAIGLPAQCGDALCNNPQLQAVLIAPLVAGGKLLGTLELGSTRLDAYDDFALQRLIHAIARVLATAIEGAQVGGNVEIQDRQRAELKDVSTVLTTAVDLQMILERIVTGITNALHVASAIVRFDKRQRRLCLEAQSGLNSLALQEVFDQQTLLSEQTIIGSTLLHRQSRVSQDIAHDERFPDSQNFASELSVRSIFCYPLITGQYVYGALLLLSPEPGGFTPLKIDIFSLFAGQATVAIQNGMLLQSAQERRRFQETIEQLERANQQNVFANQDEPGERELLNRLREETVNTFGVSLSSILRFISDHLLTRSERHLQDILRSLNAESLSEERRQSGDLPAPESVIPYAESTRFLAHLSDIEQSARSSEHEGTASLLEAAEKALARTDLLGGISAALTRALHVDEAQPQAYNHLKRTLAEPWFIVDLNGICIYLNQAAESFCGMQEALNGTSSWNRWPEESQTLFSSFRPLPTHQEASLMLEQALDAILPRMRQLREVLGYLREFTLPSTEKEQFVGESEEHEIDTPPQAVSLRCTIAAEPLPGQVPRPANAQQSARTWSIVESQEPRAIIAQPRKRLPGPPAMLLDSAPSDRHYQFIRHALYNEYGQWFANALHVHDVTEQVRDEKNKSVLLASVSHDLRTPLTTIKAAVTGLLQPDVVWDEDIRREILEDIDAETDHLHTLVNALVEMSRIEMGALSLDKEWCDIVELVHTTLKRSHRMLADFIVETHVQSPLPLIHADYAQLERVLYNLLENAARHNPGQAALHVNVDILTQKDLPPDMHETTSRAVRVQVIDNGPGVPEEERERIFKSFYSLDAQSNGLGLAICRGIVEAHQGRIWVEPGVGGGSCFVFVLPITS